MPNLLRKIIKVSSEETLNDSDKSFSNLTEVNLGWLVHSVHVNLTSTATIGNRQLVIESKDSSGDIVATIVCQATQAASLVVDYSFTPNVVSLSSAVNGVVTTPIPANGLIVPANGSIRVYDKSAVDAAADDMLVHITYEEYIA